MSIVSNILDRLNQAAMASESNRRRDTNQNNRLEFSESLVGGLISGLLNRSRGRGDMRAPQGDTSGLDFSPDPTPTPSYTPYQGPNEGPIPPDSIITSPSPEPSPAATAQPRPQPTVVPTIQPNTIPNVAPTVPPDRRKVESVVKDIAVKSFGDKEWPALRELLLRESGFNPSAQNPNSTAFGLFQFLDSTWEGSGVKKTADPRLQTIAGLNYIKQRYGSPSKALHFWKHEAPKADINKDGQPDGKHWY